MLRTYRQPTYLYFSFAALFVGYFGAFPLTAHLIRMFEESVGHLLHYHEKLPFPFRANNGLVFNALLASLAIYFNRRWQDARLARHCHFIGLPLSIAACILSGFEPTAAVICLSGYTILYAIAVWLFEAPIVVYLACAAMTGAAYFGSTLMPGMTIGTQAIGAAVLGLLFWLVQHVQKLGRADRAFRAPVLAAATALVAAAMAGATVSLTTQPELFAPMLAFWLAGLLCLLLNLEVPTAALAYLAVLNADIGYALLAQYAGIRWHWTPPIGVHAAIAAASGLGFAFCGRGLRLLGERGRRGAIFAAPLFPIALAQASLAILVAISQIALAQASTAILLAISQTEGMRPWPTPGALVWVGNPLALASATLVAVAAFAYRRRAIAYAAVITAATAVATWSLAGLLSVHVHPVTGAMGLALGVQSFVFYLVWRALEPVSEAKLYRGPILRNAITTDSASWLVAATSWPSFGYLGLAFAAGTLTLVATTREIPRLSLAYQAIAGGLGVWLCVFQIANHGETASATIYTLVVIAFALTLLAAAEATSWLAASAGVHDREFRMGPPLRASLFAVALPNFALITSIAASILVLLLPGDGERIVPLALIAFSLLWSTRFRRDLPLVYLGLAHVAGSALYGSSSTVGWGDVGLGLSWQALTMAILALLLVVVGAFIRRREKRAFYATPCLNVSAVLAVMVLILSIDARVVSHAAFPVSPIALLVNSVTGILLAVVWRRAFTTVGAVLSVVAATYVTLFSLGTPDPAKAYILGLAAALEAIALWCVGSVCRRALRPEWDRVFALPFLASAVVLATLAPAAGYNSPVAMALVSLSFLLAIKSFPRAEWLYPAIAAAGCAVYFAWLKDLPNDYLIVGAVAGGYILWASAVLAGRYGSLIGEPPWSGRTALPAPLFQRRPGLEPHRGRPADSGECQRRSPLDGRGGPSAQPESVLRAHAQGLSAPRLGACGGGPGVVQPGDDPSPAALELAVMAPRRHGAGERVVSRHARHFSC